MAKLFMMMGAAGCGKSTWCKKHITNEVYISRDEIRFSLVAEDEEYFSKENEVFRIYAEKINTALAAGKDVIADATHLNRASRNKLIKEIHVPVEEINVIWIKTPLDEILRRNAEREGRAFVPVSQVRRMYYSIEEPSFEEGISKIYIVQDGQPMIVREEEKHDS